VGDLSRMERSARFIDAFSDLFFEKSPIKVGDKLEVKEIALTAEPDYEVKLVITVQSEDGKITRDLDVIGEIYDPDYSERKLLTEDLGALLDVPEETIVGLLKQAQLYN
jgi:hypothetical protein